MGVVKAPAGEDEDAELVARAVGVPLFVLLELPAMSVFAVVGVLTVAAATVEVVEVEAGVAVEEARAVVEEEESAVGEALDASAAAFAANFTSICCLNFLRLSISDFLNSRGCECEKQREK